MQFLRITRQPAVTRGLGRPQRQQRLRVAAKASQVPPNVQEARDWIAAWRAKQAKPKPTATSGNGAAPGRKGKLEPAKSFKDGTILFTADSLAAVKYGDIKLKGK